MSEEPTSQQRAITTKHAQATPSILATMNFYERLLAEGDPINTVITRFVHDLVLKLHRHPAMACALSPLVCAQPTSACSKSTEDVPDVSFRQLVEFLGKLLEQREYGRDYDQYSTPLYRVPQGNILAVDLANFCLAGLLAWIVQHPDRPSADVTQIALSQLL